MTAAAAAAPEDDALSRLNAELSLLQAMYPDQTEWSEQARELKFVTVADLEGHDAQAHHHPHAVLAVRVPDDYPGPGADLPMIVSATDGSKSDLRKTLTSRVRDLDLPDDLEVLDQIVSCFTKLIEEGRTAIASSNRENQTPDRLATSDTERYKTVIIWLHHLLATGKRKLALNPTTNAASSSDRIHGITKPGYPGVMLFSGNSALVSLHVSELKSQRWQAFQVRFDEEHESSTQAWQFGHGHGIVEFESMAEAAQDIVRVEQREVFLKAVGVK